jgi:NADH:flavin oxidoreductases, Old Yellow Enzyme family
LYTDTIASQSYPNQPGIVTEEQTAAWAALVPKIKSHGALFIAQFMHGGGISQHIQHTLAPSAIQPLGKKMGAYGGGDGPFPFPAEISTDDIEAVVITHAAAAKRAVQAGFDGIEIHAANGYLLDQFLTDYTNVRQDAYGGSVPNRFRIIAEIIAAIKTVVPEGFIIGLRLSEGKVNNLTHRFPGGAATAKAILEEVKKADISYVHISGEGGSWERTGFYETGESFTGLAKQITRKPVIANGGLQEVAIANRVLTEGHADLIALAKGALANPDWPQRVDKGEEIRPFERWMYTSL